MKSLNIFSIALASQLISSCASFMPIDEVMKAHYNEVVSSYKSMDTEVLNDKLAKQNIIDTNPLKVILSLLKINSEQKDLVIYQTFPRIEEKENLIITVFREGYLDDSVRGEWNEVEMKKVSENKWVIISAKKAFLCWRSDSHQYQEDLCL